MWGLFQDEEGSLNGLSITMINECVMPSQSSDKSCVSGLLLNVKRQRLLHLSFFSNSFNLIIAIVVWTTNSSIYWQIEQN